MAGNRVEYIIDLVASDKQLRQSLAKLDWEKMLGSKGKGFSDVLKSNAEESKQVITSTLGGLHLDWSSILGKEQFDKMQNAIRKTVQQSSKEISALFGKGDFSGILKVINFISDLGEEFKALGGSFDNAGLIRSLGHLMKTVEGVEGATQRVGNTFNLAFKDSKWATKTTQGVERIAKALVTLGADKTAVSNIKGINAELDKISQKSKIKIDIDYSKLSEAELSEKWNEQITVLEDMDDITLDDLIDNLDLYKNRAKELIPVLTNILKIEQAAKKNKFGSFISEAIEDDIAGFGGYTTKEVKDAIKETISNLNDEINKSKEKLQEAVGDLLSGLGTVDLKLSLSDKDKNEFRDSINKYIDELNDSGTIKSINIGVTPKKIDPTKTEETIEPNKKSSEPNGRNEKVRIAEDNLNQRILKLKDEIVQREKELEEKNKAIQDYEAENSGKKNTRLIGLANRIQENINQLKEARASYETLLSMMKDSESAEIIASDWNKNQISLSSMTAKQKEILANTQTWRLKMIEAMKFSSDDLAFEYKGKSSIEGALDNLYNDIQTFFNENEINININSEGLAKQIEGVINEKGLTISGGGGGGTATIDASQLASILQAIFTGEPIPVRDVNEDGTSGKDDNENNTKPKENREEEKSVAKLNREAAQEAINLLKQFASKADKSKGGQKVADTLKYSYGIDINDINEHKYDGDIDDRIFEMLQKALMKPDEKTGLAVGRTLGNSLQSLGNFGIKKGGPKSIGFIVEALGRQINNLFSLDDVKTEHLEEAINRDKRISILDRVKEKVEEYFGAYTELEKVAANKNFKKYIDNPDLLKIEDIDKAISEIEAVGGDTDTLKQLKTAREKLGDSKDIADLHAFKNSAYEFLTNSKDIYKWLNQQMGNFKGSVKLQGRTRPWNINSPYGVANIPKDAVIEDVTVYQAFGQNYKNSPEMQPRPYKQPKVGALNISSGKFSIQERSESDLIKEINSNQSSIDEIPQLEAAIEQYEKEILELSQKINELNSFIKQIAIDVPQVDLSKFDNLNNYLNLLNTIINDATTAYGNRSEFEVSKSDLATLQKRGDETSVKQLQQYASDIHKDAVKISDIDAKIEQYTSAKSLSKTELDSLISISKTNISGATALSNLEKLRGATLPTSGLVSSVIKSFEGAGFNTDALIKLQNAANNYHPFDNDSPTNEKAKQALEEAFAQFLKETDTMFGEMKNQYGKYDIKQEQSNYDAYYKARWDKSGLDNELNRLRSQKAEIESSIVVKQESAKKIIASLQEKSSSVDSNRQKEVAELANKLREIRQSLYNEASKYVAIIRDENTDEATRNIALAKLQQVLSGLKTTKSSFAKIGHLVDVPLYDSKKQSKDVDKWTKEFIESAVVPNILGDARRQVNDITSELNSKTSAKNLADTRLNLAEKSKQSSDEANKELEFVQKYNELLNIEKQLLKEINKLKQQGADWKTIKGKYAEKSAVDDEIREFLAKNPNKDRHTYGFEAAEKYEADIRLAATQRRVYSKELADLKTFEKELKGSKFFTGKRGKQLLEDYKWSLTQKRLQSDMDNINAKYGHIDSLSIEEKDARDSEIIQARARARRFKNELDVNENNQLVHKYSFKNDSGVVEEATEVVVEDLKQELINYAGIDKKRAVKKQELKDKRLDETISELYASKQEAMRYGGVTQAELKNSKLVQEQNKLLKEIEQWEESKKVLDKKIQELKEKKNVVGLDKKEEKSLRQAKQQSADLDRKISDNYGFIADRKRLIDSNEDERLANKKSAEENLTIQTQKLTEQKAKLLAVEKEITQLQDNKKAAEKGSAEEERIKHEITNKKLEKKAIEERIDKTQEYISSLKKRAEYEKKVDVSEPKGDGTTGTTGSGGILGAIKSAVREALTGVSTNVEIDTSHLATEETLQAIYALLGGGDSTDVNRAALEEELAEINKQLEGEGLHRNGNNSKPDDDPHNLRFVYYGSEPLDINKIQPIKNTEMGAPRVKPRGGSWAAPITNFYGDEEWPNFRSYESIKTDKFLSKKFQFKSTYDIDPNAKILIVDSDQVVEQIPQYKDNTVPERYAESGWGVNKIDFEEISKMYDAMYVRPRELDDSSYYSESHPFTGWDINSLLVFNKDIIKNLKSVPIELNPDFEHENVNTRKIFKEIPKLQEVNKNITQATDISKTIPEIKESFNAIKSMSEGMETRVARANALSQAGVKVTRGALISYNDEALNARINEENPNDIVDKYVWPQLAKQFESSGYNNQEDLNKFYNILESLRTYAPDKWKSITGDFDAWIRFQTDNDVKNNSPITKKGYGTFANIGQLSQELINEILTELINNGFKGQVKIPDSLNGFFQTDQIVAHASDAQSFEAINKVFSDFVKRGIFSSMGTGVDTRGAHHESFSTLLESIYGEAPGQTFTVDEIKAIITAIAKDKNPSQILPKDLVKSAIDNVISKRKAPNSEPQIRAQVEKEVKDTLANNSLKVPVEPEVAPGAVAKEVRENVAETPVETPVEPTAEKTDYQKAVETVRGAIGDFSLRTTNANKAEKYNSLGQEVKDAANVLRTTKEGVTKEGKSLLEKMYKLREAADKVAGHQTQSSTEKYKDLYDEISKMISRSVKLGILSEDEQKDLLRLLPQMLTEEVKQVSDEDAKIWNKLYPKLLSGEKPTDDKSDLLARKAEIEGKLSGSSGGGIVGIMRTELAKESTLQKVLSTLGEIAKKNAMSGKPNSAQDLLEQFRRMLESDAWEGRERVAYMDLATGSMSNAITGDDKAISAERLRILREAYTGKMDMNAQVHTHANADDPYFSPEDLKQFGIEFANGITKQILLSKNNMTVLDMTDVKDINGLLEALAKTEHNFEALATTADKFGVKYTNKAFDALTPQGLVKMLGIKGIESKLNQEETRDSARTGVAEEDAKEAAKMLQESTGRAIKTTVQRVGVELETLVEKTDTKGNKTWTSEIGNKYQKAMEATNKSIVEQGLGNVFGKGTDAAKALTEYETHYAKLLDLVTRFKSASKEEREGLQAEINALLPTFNEAEKKLVSLIARKDRFVGDDKVVATFGAGKLKNTRKSLEAEARKRYGGKLNPGSNVAFGGYKRGQGSGQLYVDVLKDGTIKQYVLEVDQATGQVKEYVAAENALANAFQNVNKAMKQNEYVLADVAIGNTPEEQAAWMANASAPQLNEYKKAFEEMQNYTAQLWNSKESPTQQQLDYLMQLSERVIVLGKNLQKTSGEFKNFWAQNPDNVFGIDFNANDTVRSAMERYAQINASANTSKYDFVSFDNDTLKYKLTDVEGNIRNVTMVWDEMYQKVAMVSDRSVSALDPLVAKIEKYKQTIADAKSSYYLLDTDDAKFNKALKEVSVLEQKVKDGTASFDELEAARRKAIGIGEDAKKLANKNAKLYVGTNEINSVSRQRDKILGTTGFNLEAENQPTIFKNYISAYDALIAKHQEYAKQNKLNNPKIQEELRQQAAMVQKLGKQFISAATEAETLQRDVENSGDLGGIKQISTEEASNMKTTMQEYAAAVLGTNLESVKFNSTTQTMTGVFRQNNRVVSDMVVKYNDATESLYLYQKQERESLSGFPALVHGIKEKMKAIMQYVASITSIYRVWGTLKQGITYIKEIDSALTELKKVTDETEETYDKFLKTAAKTADKVGSTIKDVVSSTADWARLNI